MRFLVTEESGRLARWLRLMGYDTAQTGRCASRDVYRQAYNERRTVLTRNGRIRPGGLIRVVHLASPILDEQLRQLVRELGLAVDEAALFTRCDRCNVSVQPLERADAEDRVPPYVYQTQQRFHTCPSCHRIYWAATHWQRARALFEMVGRG